MNGATNDPHILGFEDDKFEFMGHDNKWYCLYSGGTIAVNMMTAVVPGSPKWTYVDAIAVLIGDRAKTTKLFVSIDVDENGQLIVEHDGGTLAGEVSFYTGLHDKDGTPRVGRAWVSGDTLVIETGSLEIKVTRDTHDTVMGDIIHLDTKINAMDLGLLSDGVQPHGVMGLTADWDGKPRIGTGLQGEGAIEGVYTDYEVSEPFGTDFKYNRFGTEATVTPVFGKGFGYRSVVFM